jgi:GTP 3',8-cyclase
VSTTGRGAAESELKDQLGRPLLDLRVSVTDRCNFRCSYCMPKQHFGPKFPFLPRAEILSFEEIVRLARVFEALGLRKIRITGGEPLLRKEVAELVTMLRAETRLELTLTTNGVLLEQHAEPLKRAGLDRLTVSLDALDDATFRAMNDVDVPVDVVLAGIRAAEAAGFSRLKINAVIRRGINEGAVLDLTRHFKGTGHSVRFIEFMDVGSTNGWRLDQVVSAREMLTLLEREFELERVIEAGQGVIAQRFQHRDGSGEIGIIPSVTEPFCGGCTRARISADGRLFLCLFASQGFDLKANLRNGTSDGALTEMLRDVWQARSDRYSEIRALTPLRTKPMEMSYLGG